MQQQTVSKPPNDPPAKTVFDPPEVSEWDTDKAVGAYRAHTERLAVLDVIIHGVVNKGLLFLLLLASTGIAATVAIVTR